MRPKFLTLSKLTSTRIDIQAQVGRKMHHIVKSRRRWRWSRLAAAVVFAAVRREAKIPRLVSHTKHHFLNVQTHTDTHITCLATARQLLKNQADQVKHCCLQM